MAGKKSCNAVCFKDERKKGELLSMEIQRQCECKMTPTKLPMQELRKWKWKSLLHWFYCPRPLHCPCLAQKSSSGHIPFHEIFLPTQFLYSFLKTNTLLLCFQARNMTMRVRRPLQGTLRKKIQSYDTQSKKVKKIRKPNCFFCSYECKKLNQSRKRYQNMRQSQRRRQNQKRR